MTNSSARWITADILEAIVFTAHKVAKSSFDISHLWPRRGTRAHANATPMCKGDGREWARSGGT